MADPSLTVRLAAAPRHLFGPNTFARIVGSTVQARIGDDGPHLDPAGQTLLRVGAAEVVDDGRAVLLALEPIADEPQAG